MTRHTDTVEVIFKDQRRRRWFPAEKAALVRRTYEPGMSVLLVARQEGVAASLLFQWRMLDRQVALTAVCAGEAVVPSSKLAAARAEIAKPQHQRSLGRGDDNDLDQQVWSSQLGLACGAGGSQFR
jgi:transposase-like protein